MKFEVGQVLAEVLYTKVDGTTKTYKNFVVESVDSDKIVVFNKENVDEFKTFLFTGIKNATFA